MWALSEVVLCDMVKLEIPCLVLARTGTSVQKAGGGTHDAHTLPLNSLFSKKEKLPDLFSQALDWSRLAAR